MSRSTTTANRDRWTRRPRLKQPQKTPQAVTRLLRCARNDRQQCHCEEADVRPTKQSRHGALGIIPSTALALRDCFVAEIAPRNDSDRATSAFGRVRVLEKAGMVFHSNGTGMYRVSFECGSSPKRPRDVGLWPRSRVGKGQDGLFQLIKPLAASCARRL